MDKYTAKAEVNIDASMDEVWDALTNPAKVKQYFFGTHVVSDWKKGSPILFKGEWQGKSYVDKGEILEIEPPKMLKYTYWSGFSNLPDIPENYHNITYLLQPEGEGTKLTIIQDNVKTKESRDHSEQNWGMVLDGLKKMLEA